MLPISVVLWESNHNIHWTSHTDRMLCVTPRLSFSLKITWAVNTLNRILTPPCPEGVLRPQERSWELASDAVNLWVAGCPCPGHAGRTVWGWPGALPSTSRPGIWCSACFLMAQVRVWHLIVVRSQRTRVCVCSVIHKAWQKHVLSVQRMFFSF